MGVEFSVGCPARRVAQVYPTGHVAKGALRDRLVREMSVTSLKASESAKKVWLEK